LAKAENTAENLSIALTKVSLKVGKTIERVSILAGQLEKISLSLVIIKKKEATIILKVRYIIYRLVNLRV
jgi:hypothetical protein